MWLLFSFRSGISRLGCDPVLFFDGPGSSLEIQGMLQFMKKTSVYEYGDPLFMLLTEFTYPGQKKHHENSEL